MLKITIEIIPFGFLKPRTLAVGTITNEGNGTITKGDYKVVLYDEAGKKWKECEIKNFPRTKLLAWDLLYRGLHKVLRERNKK
jgi:hypothetical protein